MAIVINYAGASLRKPGAYSRIKIAQGGAAQAQLGVMAIIGEAEEGDDFTVETGISAVTFTPEQYNMIADKYTSGELVNAARLAFTPSNDSQITGGAQELITLKTNPSVKAFLVLASTYGTVYAQKAGLPGNNTSVTIATQTGQKVITISDITQGVSEVSALIGGTTVLNIQVTGAGPTAATMTINATSLKTTITGTGVAALNIPLAQFSTIGQLVEFISGQPGYTCTIGAGQTNSPLSVMDRVTAANIFTTLYALKRDAYDVKKFFDESSLVTFTPTAYVGLPATLAKTFLASGAKGGTTNAIILDAIDECLKARINFIVPLFSRDATDDIADGLTDDSSTYTIDSIHSAVRTHVVQASTVKGRKERQAWVAYKGDYDDAVDKSITLGSSRVSLCFQDVDVQDSFGEIYTAQPHILSALAAGMKCAASVGLPNTFKLLNINGFTHSTFDPEVDYDSAIESNLTFVEKAPGGGFRWVVDNNTYGQEKDAWILNRPSVVYAADTAAFSIRLNVETFVGQRNSDLTPETVKNLLITVMDGLRSSGIIVPDSNTNGKGYKDLTVSFEGSIIRVGVTLALVEGFEFVLNDIQVTRAVA